jgi:hypothetical protein
MRREEIMKRFGMRRVVRYGGAAGVLAAVAVAIALAAATAQASPNKPYTANVRQTLNAPGTFTFTLTNDPHASQQLGSANFTPPLGVTVAGVGTNVTHTGWTATVDNAGILEFRSNSSANGLKAGQSVSADVTFTTTSLCTATPGTATWQVRSKQSNDFSGQPGNDLTLGSTSDLTPLGSFVVAPVQTGPPTTTFNVPQIKTNSAAQIGITALDTCGNVDKDYSGATLNKEADFGLANATFSALSWSNGIGSATVTPVDVEVGDQFSVNDPTTGISATSISTGNNPTFDVVQTICAGGGASCEWKDPSGKPITADSTVNNDNGGHASLGLGYKPFRNGVTCGVGSPIGDSIYIDPYQYSTPYTVVLTYGKSLAPKGPASNVVICKSLDNGASWDRSPIPPCPSTPVAPCESAANAPGGALRITLYLLPGDPHSGGFTP